MHLGVQPASKLHCYRRGGGCFSGRKPLLLAQVLLEIASHPKARDRGKRNALSADTPSVVVVYAVVDDALSPDFPLGVELETFIRREDAERLIRRCAATILRSRVTCESSSASSR